jgi:hypothetical protein
LPKIIAINSTGQKLKQLYKYRLAIAMILFSAGAVYLFPFLRYYADDGDSYSYIYVAEKYARGNFGAAINGTWSPLISMLLSLLMQTHADSFMLFKLLQIGLGAAGLLMTSRLISILKINKGFGFITTLCMVPVFWSYSFCDLSADLLFLDVLLLLHVLLLSYNGIGRRRAILIGLSGALLYLAKAYGIFFFPVLCLFSYLLFYRANKIQKEQVVRNAIVSMTVFLAVSSLWITAISMKYRRFTISDAPAYNVLLERFKAGVVYFVLPK